MSTPPSAEWLSRMALIIAPTQLHTLQQAHVLVVGLGGVGGIAAEMLARAGVGTLTLVDADTIEPTNRNRQVAALHSTNLQPKVAVMASRLADINPNLQLHTHQIMLNRHSAASFVQHTAPHYVLDCIDTLSAKVALIVACLQLKIPFVSAMGAGGKVDPTRVQLGDIAETKNDFLARYVRKRLSPLGIKSGFRVVHSTELPDAAKLIMAPEGSSKKSIIGTISYMPNIFGCMCAAEALRVLAQINWAAEQ